MPIWSAERVLTCQQACELLAEQFPQLCPILIEEYGFGWDNTAFLVNGEYLFRFPRRKIAVNSLQREMEWLPKLAPRFSLSIPHPVFFGDPSVSFPWPFAGYRLIPGKTACRANLDENQREAIAIKLAEFLRVLHTLPADNFKIPEDEYGTLDVSRRIPKIEENIEVILEYQLADSNLPYERILSTVAGVKPKTPGRIVHGDLYVRHLILGTDDSLCGIIDWGDLQRNDPAIDLALVFSFLPPGQARDTFWSEYGLVDDQRRQLARMSALDHILSVLRYGHEIGDEALLREGQLGLNYVLSG